MESKVETSSEPKKEWAKPELKVLDIEKITSTKTGGTTDALGTGMTS